MADPIYAIPPGVIPGFEQIIDLNPAQLDFFKSVLERMASGKTSDDSLENLASEVGIPLRKVDEIMGSIMSTTDIYWRSKDTPEKFAEDFTQSFIEENKNAKNLDLVKFEKNIAFFASAMGTNMRATVKAREIIVANQNNYSDAKIVSDIRIVFDDDNKLDKKEQIAVIVHNLRIRYNSMPRSQIFISLDLSDLHSLKDVINRAIEKDNLMRANTHSLTFVNPQ